MSDEELCLNRNASDISALQEDPQSHYKQILAALATAKSSRRNFLLGLGTVSGTLPLVGHAARAASNFSVDHAEGWLALKVGDAIGWEIRESWFDGEPKLVVQSQRDALRVQLTGGFFPGTNLPADVRVYAIRKDGHWVARLALPALGYSAQCRFDLWLLGLEPAEAPFEAKDFAVRAARSVGFQSLAGRACFSPAWAFIGDALGAGGLVHAGGASKVEAFSWQLKHSISQEGAPTIRFRAEIKGCHDVSLEAQSCRIHLEGRQALLLDSSAERATLRIDTLAQGQGVSALEVLRQGTVRLPVESASVTHSFSAQENEWRASVSLLEGRWVPFEGGAAQFAPAGDAPLLLASTSMPDASSALAPPHIARFVVPVASADVVQFERRPPKVGSFQPRHGDDVFLLAENRIPLDAFDMRIGRAVDGLHCCVRFRNVQLRHSLRGWRMEPMAGTARGDALIEFDFGSQHLLEEAIYFTQWCQAGGGGNAVIPVSDEVAAAALIQLDKDGKYPPNFPVPPTWPPEQFIAALKASERTSTMYPEFRMRLANGAVTAAGCVPLQVPRFKRAGATRLVFRLDTNEGFPLGMHDLFAWADVSPGSASARKRFVPLVSRRALARGEPGLPRGWEHLNERISDPLSIADDLPQAGFAEYATRIEAPADLVMSPVPDSDGGLPVWRSPPRPPEDTSALATRAEVWNVHIAGADMRALYSPKATIGADGKVAVFSAPRPFDPNNCAPGEFRASYDARDLHEIVSLTAVYGFEALCGSRDVLCSNGKVVINNRSPNWPYASTAGRYTPVPLKAEILLLSNLGASLRYRGTWSPPSSVQSLGALTIMRYDHNVQLGRDTYARVEYKGFLFPIGHPAVLVKLTERRFCLEAHNRWVSRLVQRYFIHVPEFTRSFVAVGLKHDRLWGHINTGMKAFTTPDLDDPTNESIAGLGVAAFWPRVSVPGGVAQDVSFEYHEAQTQRSYASPLVFVDNNVAHNKMLLKGVVDHWRSEVGVRVGWELEEWDVPRTGVSLRDETEHFFARVTSGKLGYVPGERGENAEVETDRILLGVAAPEDDVYDDSAVDADRLIVTPLMEADDQPPFYPVRRRARIKSTQLAVLTGSSAGRFLLQFDDVFLRHGLADTHNARQVFGVFVDPKRSPKMNFGDDTSRSGAFASPSAGIVWLSKSRGPIGGPADKVVALGAVQPIAKAFGAPEEDHPDDFNPKSYLAQVLGDAKLLGVVKLVDVLEVLTVATGTKIPTIKRQNLYDLALPALRSALDAIQPGVDRATSLLADVANQKDTPQAAAVEFIWPAWQEVLAAYANAKQVAAQPAPSLAALLGAVDRLGSAADGLAAAVKALTKDPSVLLPEAAKVFIVRAKPVLEAVRELLPPQKAIEHIKRLVIGAAAEVIRERLRGAAVTLAAKPEVARLRASILRLAEVFDEFERGLSDLQAAQKLLQANLTARLKDAADDLSAQLAYLYALGQQQCGIYSRPLVGIVVALASKAQTAAADAAMACQAFSKQIESAGAQALGAADDKTRPFVLQAQQACMAIANFVNGEAQELSRLAEGAVNVRSWSGPCDGKTPQALIDLVHDALNYVLLAPDRAASCLVLLRDVSEGMPEACRAVFAVWSDAATASLAEFLSETVKLDEVVQATPVLKAALGQQVAKAIEAANEILSIRNEVNALAQSGEAFATAMRGKLDEHQGKFERAVRDLQPMRSVLQAVAMYSPRVFDDAVRARLLLQAETLRTELLAYRNTQVDVAWTEARRAVGVELARLGVRAKLTTLAQEGSYLSQEVKFAMTHLSAMAAACTTPMPQESAERDLANLAKASSSLFALLSRAIAGGDVGALVDLDAILDDLVAQLGVPTRIRLDYDWSTNVIESPQGEEAIFEPLEDRELTISAVIEASLSGGTPSVSLRANLSPFAVHLFGKSPSSNFLSIYLDGLLVTAAPGRDVEVLTDVTLVKPGAALGFVAKLGEVLGGRSGFFVYPSTRGITVGYQYSRPDDFLGGFYIQNLDFLVSVRLPFDNAPVRTTVQLASKEKPFLLSAGIYGGGGFLSIRTRADTLEILEASFEYGAVSAFSFGPVRGSGRITAGIYIRMGGRNPVIEGFFCAAGEASIAGLITVAAMLRVSLRYFPSTGQTSGDAVFTFKFSIGPFDYRYRASVAYAKNGDQDGSDTAQLDSGSPLMLAHAASSTASVTASDQPPPLAALAPKSRQKAAERKRDAYAGLLVGGAWQRYWSAFEAAPRPEPDLWLSAPRPLPPGSTKPVARTDAGLKAVHWFVVPWGFTDDGGLLAGVRIMPTVISASSPARRDWPALLASVGSVSFRRDGTGKEQEVALGDAYVRRLKQWGLTVADASRLWKAIFPESLPTLSESESEPDPKAAAKTVQVAMHKSHDLAQAVDARVGLVFAGALKYLDSTAFGLRPVVPKSADGVVGPALASLAAIYEPMSSTITKSVKSSFRAKAIDEDPAYAWVAGTVLGVNLSKALAMASPGNPVSIELATPYSRAALGTLMQRSAYALDTADMLEDRLAQQLVLKQAAYFPDTVPGRDGKPVRRSTPPPEQKDDFHKRLAGLASHPWLMKVLGLVVDTDIPDMHLAHSVHVSRWDNIVPSQLMVSKLDRTGFPSSKKQGAVVREGVVDLSARGGRFSLTQLDTDRTPERLLQAAIAYRSQFVAGTHPAESPVSVQPQETVGLSLIEHVDTRTTNLRAAGNDEELLELFLEDLQLGIRPDVLPLQPNQDATGARLAPATSLMARRIRRIEIEGMDVTARFARLFECVDEGVLVEKMREVRQTEGGKLLVAELREGELFRWDTWPMGAPRPDSDSAPVAALPEGTEVPPSMGALPGVAIEYEVLPGATPQRIGRGYRIGARAAMIDGNSVPLHGAEAGPYVAAGDTLSLGDEMKDDPTRGWVPIRRYEPVSPPKVLMHGRFESRLLGQARAARAVVTSEDGCVCRRVIVPPRCASIELAIRHGVFDGRGMHMAPPVGAFTDVVLTPEGDFPSKWYAYSGLPDPAPGGEGERRRGTTEAYFHRLTGTSVLPREIPYYPDPWAKRVIIALYRVGDDQLMYVDFFDYYAESSWPEAKELEIEVKPVKQVRDTVRGFDVVIGKNKRTILLAPSTHLAMRVWHEIDQQMLEDSAVVEQIVAAACDPLDGAGLCRNIGCANTTPAGIRGCIIGRLSNWMVLRDDDRHVTRPDGVSFRNVNLASFWMINPMQEVELLHAALEPQMDAVLSGNLRVGAAPPRTAKAPALTTSIEEAFAIVRREAETSANFVGHVSFDRPGTRQVDALARWSDNATSGRRRGGKFEIAVEQRQGMLFQLKQLASIAEDDKGMPPLAPLAPELGPEQRLQKLDAVVRVSEQRPKDSRPVVAPYDFGDTRARVLEVTLSALARHQSEFAAHEKHPGRYERKSRPQRVVVHATQRPDAPQVHYVMPLYGWRNEGSGGALTRTRESGWFRVWLGKEWYSSGNGEMLALVCWPSQLLERQDRSKQLSFDRHPPWHLTEPPKEVEPWVTRWGLDPLMGEDIPFGAMPASALTNRAKGLVDVRKSAALGDTTLENDLHHLADAPTFEPVFDLSRLPELADKANPRGRSLNAGLALYRPCFDASIGRWYADIHVELRHAYQPFLRLALARWQPHGLKDGSSDLRLSRIAATEFVQLLPERSVTVVPERVTGVKRHYEVVVAGGFLGPRAQGARSRLRLRVEQHFPNRAGDTWVPVTGGPADGYIRGSADLNLTGDVFRATVQVDHALGAKYSIVLEEREELLNDSSGQESRLVYFDRVPLAV